MEINDENGEFFFYIRGDTNCVYVCATACRLSPSSPRTQFFVWCGDKTRFMFYYLAAVIYAERGLLEIKSDGGLICG